jgi:NADP-dependent 3-hydroxy acid dehydrogenase YdfG
MTVTPDERKVAVITGSSQGIGAALVTGYRRAGYAVVGAARSAPADGENDVITVVGDIADAQTAKRVVDTALDRFGRIDTVINNAGIYIGKPFTAYTLDDYEAITAVNLTGFFHITQLAIAQMVGQGGGHVVNISTSLVDHADAVTLRPGGADQGRTRRRDPFAGDRVRVARRARQRGLAGGDRDSRTRPCVV